LKNNDNHNSILKKGGKNKNDKITVTSSYNISIELMRAIEHDELSKYDVQSSIVY